MGLLVALAAVVWLVFFRDEKPDFSGARAMRDLTAQVAFGPRIPGSEGHARTRRMLLDSLGTYADRVGEQAFTFRDPGDSTTVYEGYNIVASFNLNPEVERRIMLAAHWDTRPYADQDPDSSKQTLPVPGANDGASGVAVLLEMARLFHAQPPDVGVDLVFFDLEDLGEDSEDTTAAVMPFAVGSEYFAAHAGYRPTFGILVDMVCDRNLRIPKEANSVAAAPAIVEKVWDAADRVDAAAFEDEVGQAVYDDHVPFLRRGIPVIDLIHTPFPDYWHTTADMPDQCSAESLEQVGEVLVEVVYEE